MSLFGAAGGGGSGGGGGGGGVGVMVQFNAGKCKFDAGTNRVTPEPAKGTVTVSKDMTQMLTLVWSNRETGEQDDPVMLFSGDVKFLKCKSCTQGRVYYLCFQNERREFFWMQSIEDAKDSEHMAAVNAAINGDTPASSAASGSGNSTHATSEELARVGIDEENLQVLQALSEEERQQMAIMLGLNGIPSSMGSTGSSEAPETPATRADPAGSSDTPATTDTPSAPPPVRPNETGTSASTAAGSSAADSFDANMLQSVLSGVGQQMQVDENGPKEQANSSMDENKEEIKAGNDKKEGTEDSKDSQPSTGEDAMDEVE